VATRSARRSSVIRHPRNLAAVLALLTCVLSPLTATATAARPGVPASVAAGTCAFLLSGLTLTYSATSIAINGSGTCEGTAGSPVTIDLSGTPVFGCTGDVISLGGTVSFPTPGADSVSALFTGNVAAMHLLITGAHVTASATLVGTYPYSPANCALRQTGASNLAGSMTYVWV
jgi:hypothetical protein